MAACQIWKQADIEKSWAEYYSVSRKGKFKRLPFPGEGWKDNETTLKNRRNHFPGDLEGTFFPIQEEPRMRVL